MALKKPATQATVQVGRVGLKLVLARVDLTVTGCAAMDSLRILATPFPSANVTAQVAQVQFLLGIKAAFSTCAGLAICWYAGVSPIAVTFFRIDQVKLALLLYLPCILADAALTLRDWQPSLAPTNEGPPPPSNSLPTAHSDASETENKSRPMLQASSAAADARYAAETALVAAAGDTSEAAVLEKAINAAASAAQSSAGARPAILRQLAHYQNSNIARWEGCFASPRQEALLAVIRQAGDEFLSFMCYFLFTYLTSGWMLNRLAGVLLLDATGLIMLRWAGSARGLGFPLRYAALTSVVCVVLSWLSAWKVDRAYHAVVDNMNPSTVTVRGQETKKDLEQVEAAFERSRDLRVRTTQARSRLEQGTIALQGLRRIALGLTADVLYFATGTWVASFCGALVHLIAESAFRRWGHSRRCIKSQGRGGTGQGNLAVTG